MNRPHPLAVAAMLAPVALAGLLLWRSNGIDIWLQQAMSWCF